MTLAPYHTAQHIVINVTPVAYVTSHYIGGESETCWRFWQEKFSLRRNQISRKGRKTSFWRTWKGLRCVKEKPDSVHSSLVLHSQPQGRQSSLIKWCCCILLSLFQSSWSYSKSCGKLWRCRGWPWLFKCLVHLLFPCWCHTQHSSQKR